MARDRNENIDAIILQHVRKGDLIACISTFRGLFQTVSSDPRQLKHLLGNYQYLYGKMFSGGVRFDEHGRLLLPEAYDKEHYRQRISNMLLRANRERSRILRNWWLRYLQYSYVLTEDCGAGEEPAAEETFVIFAPPDRLSELYKGLKDACGYFGIESALLIKNGTAYQIFPDKPDRELGIFRPQPDELAACYGRIKGKALRFGDIKEIFKGRRHFDQISEALSYKSGMEIFRKTVEQNKNYFQFLEESQAECEKADRAYMKKILLHKKNAKPVHKWKDNDYIVGLLDVRQLRNGCFPRRCPVCQRKSAHIYLHRFNGRRLGSGWAWCSSCQRYAHVRCYIPEWWTNLPAVEENRLAAVPEYLEGLKDSLDAHINSFTESSNG